MNIWLEFLAFASIKAALLIGLMLLTDRFLQRRLHARRRFVLWCLVLLPLVVPPILPIKVSVSGVGTALTRPSDAPQTSDAVIGSPAHRQISSAHATASRNSDPQHTSRPLPWAVLIFGVWAAVSAALLAMLLRSQLHLTRCLRDAAPVHDPQILRLLESCKRELRVSAPVALLQSDALLSAVVVGVWRPRIILPAGFARALDADAQRHVLLHELAHVRRRDLLLNWLATVVQVLHWFNPLTWVAVRHLRLEQELACDEAVLAALTPAQRRGYGHTLINLSEFGLNHPALGMVAVMEDKRTLQRRLVMIGQYRQSGNRSGRFVLVPLAAVIGVALTYGVTSQAQTAQDPTPPAKATDAAPAVVVKDEAGNVIPNEQVPAMAMAALAKEGKVTEVYKSIEEGQVTYTGVVDVGDGKLANITVDSEGGLPKWALEAEEVVEDEPEIAVDKTIDTLPAKVKETFLREARGGKLDDLYAAGDLYGGTAVIESKIYHLEVKEDGTLIGKSLIGEEVTADKVPAAAMATIIKASEGGKIISIVKDPSFGPGATKEGKHTYVASTERDGKAMDVAVGEDGELIFKLHGAE